ncbi:uncharacterized protein LOC106866138 [Brachypodium distachyon]|nr:uncharacterized protein LOC106866138 [Brachypodium distachyon]|eukprot:XP_014754373.1 uncharacterized protein LOC106866138 [Brachypodium distachyon]
MSRNADDLLAEYCPLTSGGGLVLLCRRHPSPARSSLCVYDPFTGHRVFLRAPPGAHEGHLRSRRSLLLLTAAEDGIGFPFLLIFFHDPGIKFSGKKNSSSSNGNTRVIQVHVAAAPCGALGEEPVAILRDDAFSQLWPETRPYPVVLPGGVIHWLLPHGREILTYDVLAANPGSRVKLPAALVKADNQGLLQLHLASYTSPDDGRKLLKLLVADGLKISVWRQLSGGGGWELEEGVIDAEEKLRELDPDFVPGQRPLVGFACFGESSSGMVLPMMLKGVFASRSSHRVPHILVDLETREMTWKPRDSSTDSSALLIMEVDLPSRLRAMKVFS